MGKQKCQAIEIWSRQRSQRWSPQRIRIHARNSVRVAQTTAISPAAPAHRTALSATSSNPLGKQNFLRNGKRVCANICSGQTDNMGKDNLIDYQLWSWGCASSYTRLISIHMVLATARTSMTSMNSRISYLQLLSINTKEKRSVSLFFVPFASARAKLKTPSLNATKARRTRRPNPWRNDPRDAPSQFWPGFDQVWSAKPQRSLFRTTRVFHLDLLLLLMNLMITNILFFLPRLARTANLEKISSTWMWIKLHSIPSQTSHSTCDPFALWSSNSCYALRLSCFKTGSKDILFKTSWVSIQQNIKTASLLPGFSASVKPGLQATAMKHMKSIKVKAGRGAQAKDSAGPMTGSWLSWPVKDLLRLGLKWFR